MPTARPSLKHTLGYGDDVLPPSERSLTATLTDRGAEATPFAPIELEDTLDLAASGVQEQALASAPSSTMRTTVLPHRRTTDASADAAIRPRFARVRSLGAGAMGEIELARDNDIRRTVALKRLRHDATSQPAMLRFADEIRIVGQLEHPSIVPIYDVGQDEDGKVYLVMKHLHGETMEDVIEKLRSADAQAREKYTITYRVQLFLKILDAIRYAHARGILHRDLKPANIMIGPYGEVTVLDWGIAKPLKGARATETAPLDATLLDSHDARLLETRAGSLAGTPLYMSPEQAAGKNDELDQRSDVYALCVMLYEWLVLRHPLAHHTTVQEVLASIIARDYSWPELRDWGFAAQVPMEYLLLVRKGLQRDRASRFQSVAELEHELNEILAGRVHIQCHVTLAKRLTHSALHWIDRHTVAYSMLFFGVVLTMLGSCVFAAVMLVRALR